MKLSFNESKMVFIVSVDYGEGNGDEILGEVSARYEVCPRCDGKGTHVNPSIDGNGLTYEDFEREGPTFREDYFAGVYDVTCYNCEGKRVTSTFTETPTEEEKKIIQQYQDWNDEEEEFERMCAAERRMGA